MEKSKTRVYFWREHKEGSSPFEPQKSIIYRFQEDMDLSPENLVEGQSEILEYEKGYMDNIRTPQKSFYEMALKAKEIYLNKSEDKFIYFRCDVPLLIDGSYRLIRIIHDIENGSVRLFHLDKSGIYQGQPLRPLFAQLIDGTVKEVPLHSDFRSALMDEYRRLHGKNKAYRFEAKQIEVLQHINAHPNLSKTKDLSAALGINEAAFNGRLKKISSKVKIIFELQFKQIADVAQYWLDMGFDFPKVY